VVASHPEWTGIGFHEWLAAIVVLPALYHLVVNWDWVARVAVGFIGKLKAASRINLVVDIVLFLATITVMVSGVMVIPGVVSTAVGTTILGVWSEAHRISSYITILAMVAHFLLHAEWMTDVAFRSFAPKPGRHAVGRPVQLARAGRKR
jgi:hypothetical protein